MKKVFSRSIIILLAIGIGIGVFLLPSNISVTFRWLVSFSIAITMGGIGWLIHSSVYLDHPRDEKVDNFLRKDRTKERLFRWFAGVFAISVGVLIWFYPLNIDLIRHVFVSLAVILVIGGIAWILHSDKYLRQVWQLEKKLRELNDSDDVALKDELKQIGTVLRELRDVDRNWATVFFAGAALIIALLALLKV